MSYRTSPLWKDKTFQLAGIALLDGSGILLDTRHKVWLAKVLYRVIHGMRRILGLQDRIVVRRSGIQWQLELNEGIDLAIYLFGAFERSAVDACVRTIQGCSKPIVLDIGANIGAYTLPLAVHVSQKGGTVHAFEPTRWAFEKLNRNLAANPRLQTCVKARQAFLSTQGNRQVPLGVESSWPLQNAVGADPVQGGKTHGTEGAASFTVDEYIASEGIQQLDLMKLDVDGHEAMVLAGATDCLQKLRPTLIIEWAPIQDKDGALRMTLEQLLRSGYRVQGIGGSLCKLNSLEQLEAKIPKKGGIIIQLEPIPGTKTT